MTVSEHELVKLRCMQADHPYSISSLFEVAPHARSLKCQTRKTGAVLGLATLLAGEEPNARERRGDTISYWRDPPMGLDPSAGPSFLRAPHARHQRLLCGNWRWLHVA